MSATAYLFPGQGSQAIGMGRGLFERFPKHTELASDFLGYRVDILCLRDPDRHLSLTQFTQPALYVVGALTHLAQFEDDDRRPAALAGHSLGEYVALHAAGVFDFETGLSLVRERARLMAEVSGSGMAAVTEMSSDDLAQILRAEAGLDSIDIANFNTATQTVVSGDLGQLERLRPIVMARGGQYFPLRVSGAFHSRYMRKAQERFEQFAAATVFAPPRIPVIANATAQPYAADADAVRAVLVSQISNPVRWLESIQWLMRAGVTQFVEVGPGKVLSRLAQNIVERGRAAAAEQPVVQAGPAADRTRAIFICPGQGGQHFGMGRTLYERHAEFRACFDECAALGEPLLGESIAELVYRPNDASAEFSRTLHTHVANFALTYSMVSVLRAEGTDPCCFVGWSLGEYVALAASGALSLREALGLVARQALDIEALTEPAAMLAVLTNVHIYYTLTDAFESTSLAGILADDAFVVTASAPRIEQTAQHLAAKGFQTHRLPIRHGFHSAYVDPVASSFKASCAEASPQPPTIPIYSSVLRERVTSVTQDYLWNICRARFNFRTALMRAAEQYPQAALVDLGASGTGARYATAILGRSVDVRHALLGPRMARTRGTDAAQSGVLACPSP